MTDKEKQDYKQVQARLLAKHLIESKNRRKENSQEQIEEMAREVENAKEGLWNALYFEDDSYDWHSRGIAKHLFGMGYRKIPEGSVVLSREEYENLGLAVETIQEYECVNGQPKLIKEKKLVKKLKTDFVDLLNQEIRELQIAQQARKETAMEILKFLKEHTFDSSFCIIQAYFNEQFGVEVE